MMCAWKELLAILPQWMRPEVDALGRDSLQELRLRLHAPPELVTAKGITDLNASTDREDLQFVINAASRYSPWAAETMAQGYLTAPGGHRIGICGDAVCHSGTVSTLRRITSLCIRVARDIPGAAKGISVSGSLLIVGAPGWGKTTLLRDLARQISQTETVAVVDEREELFPEGFQRGKRMDVLSGSPKAEGISQLLRTMGPQWIALDEITAEEDARALLYGANCGVKLLATAHASSMEELRSRRVYRPILDANILDSILLLNRDKQWCRERVSR